MNAEEKIDKAAEEKYLKGVYLINGFDVCELSKECFVDGAKSESAKEYWFEQFFNPEKVNRVEVINHNSVDKFHTLGRVFTHYNVKSCELSFQDNFKTLKIFI